MSQTTEIPPLKIEARWKAFLASVSWGASEKQIQALRMAFYGGAASIYGLLEELRESSELRHAVGMELLRFSRSVDREEES